MNEASQNLVIVQNGYLIFKGKHFRCAIGKSAFSLNKREGDGCTPLGVFGLRECWYRADRLNAPKTKLPLKIIHPDDGWCDDPKSPEYNRHVKLPYGFSHEQLWREDHVYDLIVPIGYNDERTVPGKGSAIFLHIAHEDYRGTEGCVALACEDLLALLPELSPESLIDIRK